MTDYLFKQFSDQLHRFMKDDLPAWVGEAHADLISLVGKGAIQRTAIKSGRLVSNWQGWVGESTIVTKAGEVSVFSPSPAGAYVQIDRLAEDVESKGEAGVIVEKTVVFNNTPYALVEEEGNASRRGKHMALGGIQDAEQKWGDGTS